MSEKNVHALLDRAWEHLSRGEQEAAAKIAQEALSLEPEHPEALHLLAEIALNRDEIESSERYTTRALTKDPEYFPSYLMRVHIALAKDSFDSARSLAEAALTHAHNNDDSFEARLLLAELLLEEGKERLAQKQILEAFKAPPLEPTLIAQLGEALLDLCRDPNRAQSILEPAAKEHKNNADLRYALGRAYQEQEDPRYIEEFLVVHSLEEAQPKPPFGLSKEAFLQAAEDSFANLPDEIKEQLEDVAILVEDRPSRALVEGGLDPRSMGLFDGPPVSHGKNGHATPTRILLFQHNIELACQSKEQILEEIEITLLHEIGHYLGLEEDDLYERGLN